jgi:NAD(P)-dependent dehydrogenase (short-subunit alcohol dehydrogenase family)
MIKKNIIITGATSGIGRSVVQEMDCESNHLILFGRSPEKLGALVGGLKTSSTCVVLDLADINSIAEVASQLPARIDGFVHAAGLESVEPIRLIRYEKFDYLMRLHVYAFVEILKIIERAKKKTDDYNTSVVAISSIASDNGGVGQTMYAASKAALEAAIRVLAKELAVKRIRINAVKPGIVDTEMTRRWMNRIGIAEKADVESLQLNGMAQPHEVASLIIFLLSDQARHIVGTQVKIDGGGPVRKFF